ncbi:MAG: PIN domain-containing protein, partial [Oscillospiraceae bacterium]|nr:PIN domain-containing protein [Oscillospiraceae bacterium]
MKYLLDTDTCVYFLNRNEKVAERIGELVDGDAAISIITLAELQFGAYNSERVEQNLKRVEFLAQSAPILPLNETVTDCYARIKASLRKAGTPLADFDILIGATAIANNLTLVTNNDKHF